MLLLAGSMSQSAKADSPEWKPMSGDAAQILETVRHCPNEFAQLVAREYERVASAKTTADSHDGTRSWVIKTVVGGFWGHPKVDEVGELTIVETRYRGPMPTDAPARFSYRCEFKALR